MSMVEFILAFIIGAGVYDVIKIIITQLLIKLGVQVDRTTVTVIHLNKKSQIRGDYVRKTF